MILSIEYLLGKEGAPDNELATLLELLATKKESFN